MRKREVVDEFQLTAIIAKAISACPVDGTSSEQPQIANEQATCMAKVIVTALAEAGFRITVEPSRPR